MSPLPVPDWARVFDVAPAPFLLLTPDLVIVHANRARLEATATTLEDTVGRHLFDAFPMPPHDPAAGGRRDRAGTPPRARREPPAPALEPPAGRRVFGASPRPPAAPSAAGLRTLRATPEEARDTR